MSRDGSGRLRQNVPDWWGGFARNQDGGDSGWSLGFGANSTLTTRHQIAKNAGLQFGGDRDLYDVLGWNRSPSVEDYWAMYLRNPMGRVIVNAPAATSWRVKPDIEEDDESGNDDETEFESAVDTLFDTHRIVHYMERADKVSGIGEYGIIVLGLADDAGSMAAPVESGQFASEGLDALDYLATFSQDRVTDIDLVNDPTSPRYGLPEYYDVQFDTDQRGRSQRVHYSRIIHVAEELLEDEVYGRPRLEAVFNTLYDIEKVLGGAAEMTWRGAGLRMQLDINPEMGEVPDADDVAEQAEEMVMGLRHIMRTRGTDMNVIEGQTVDPSGITGELLKLIAGETGIPQRILTGSERGELASTQDRATFYGRITERQEQFCEPQMLRPLIDRLVDLGVLPEYNSPDGYTVEWPDLFELSELEQAELMEKMAAAMKNAAPMGDPGQLGTTAEIRQEVLGWDPEMGAETGGGFDDPELIEEDIENRPETDEERDAFEEILDSVDDLDPSDAESYELPNGDTPVATDGGNEE